jgi:hypothetical protein
MDATLHTTHSSYREMVLEHLFVGEVMRYCWSNDLGRIEMLKSQVDNSGYDIVLESDRIMRHVQLKASHLRARTPSVAINTALEDKPSGCVIWMFFDESSLQFQHFLWFGSTPGQPFETLKDMKTLTHTKRNARGVKTERINMKVLPRARFERLESIGDIVNRLFGKSPGLSASTHPALGDE